MNAPVALTRAPAWCSEETKKAIRTATPTTALHDDIFPDVYAGWQMYRRHRLIVRVLFCLLS